MVFDVADAHFFRCVVYADLNSGGVSQANELKSLGRTQHVAINLDSTTAKQNSNGNLISSVGTYVRGDGTAKSIG